MDTRKVLLASKLAIVLLLVYTGSSTLLVRPNSTELFEPASAGGSEDLTASDTGSSDVDTSDDFSVIVERGIFGTTPHSLGPGESGSFPSASKELGIELVGTVAGTPAVSRAIIKDTKTKALGLYKTGQSVAGATIQSIQLNTVVLLHNGRRKTLSLKAAEAGISTGSARPARSAVETTSAAPYLPANRVNSQPGAGPASSIGYVEEILSRAAIVPHVVNGEIEGLKIAGLEKVPAAALLGLEDGDIVRRVNGQQLTSLQKAFQVFQKAKTQPAIRLELSRGGETKELKFDLH